MPPKKIEFDEQTELSSQPEALVARRERTTLLLRFTDSAGAHEVALGERSVVGSAATCDAVVRDPTVSRLHAELERREDGLWLRDLGSRNGTWIGAMRVAAAMIPPGTELRVGSTRLRVESTDRVESIVLWAQDHFGPLVGRSTVMRELFSNIAAVAATEATVLVRGETGSGKELVARAIHDASARKGGPFIVVDCGALAESLLESELFGHAKGAFTGADVARAGAIESADGGTVFLDEVGELPLAMQPKLLRAIESHSVRRVGESQYRQVDVRFVSATHRDLRTMVNAGTFREDLYFRLAVVPLEVPPLRARPDDIGLLIERFLPSAARAGFDANVLHELAGRPWSGNVRELRNWVDRARALGIGPALRLDRDAANASLRPPASMSTSDSASSAPAVEVSIDETFKDLRDRMLEDLERRYIGALLQRHSGNVTAVAQAAGLNRGYVHRLIKKHGL